MGKNEEYSVQLPPSGQFSPSEKSASFTENEEIVRRYFRWEPLDDPSFAHLIVGKGSIGGKGDPFFCNGQTPTAALRR